MVYSFNTSCVALLCRIWRFIQGRRTSSFPPSRPFGIRSSVGTCKPGRSRPSPYMYGRQTLPMKPRGFLCPHRAISSIARSKVCGDSWEQLEGCTRSVPSPAVVGARSERTRLIGGSCCPLFFRIAPEEGRKKERSRWDGKEGWVQVCALQKHDTTIPKTAKKRKR